MIRRSDSAIDRCDYAFPISILIDLQDLDDIAGDVRAIFLYRARDYHGDASGSQFGMRAFSRTANPCAAAEIICVRRVSLERSDAVAHFTAHRIVLRPLRAPEIHSRSNTVIGQITDNEDRVA